MGNTDYTAEYVKSINGTDKILYHKEPQIAFLGRSNVGKSSLINSLIGQNLARSSSKPGKTITIDFFVIDPSRLRRSEAGNKMYFVDLPGYGFAHRSQEQREHFRKLIAWYLFAAEVKHKFVVLIIDAVVGITDYDRESIELFRTHNTPFIIVANKIDKLKIGERIKHLAAIKREAGDILVVPYSTVTGEGRSELLRYILS